VAIPNAGHKRGQPIKEPLGRHPFDWQSPQKVLEAALESDAAAKGGIGVRVGILQDPGQLASVLEQGFLGKSGVLGGGEGCAHQGQCTDMPIHEGSQTVDREDRRRPIEGLARLMSPKALQAEAEVRSS
jgi:hypothetical protein